MIRIKKLRIKRPRVVCCWNSSEVKEIKMQYERENKQNQSNNEIKQERKLNGSKRNLKNNKNNKNIKIKKVTNKMQVL